LFVLLITLFTIPFNISYADDNAPKFDCTLTDQVAADGTPGDAKDTFTQDTSEIYLVCHSDQMNVGQILKSVWIAADTGGVAPPNYQIDEKEITVTSDMANSQGSGTADFTLTKPNDGWPTGSYHVDLYIDDVRDQSINFSVK
jgi:hypothetical protein